MSHFGRLDVLVNNAGYGTLGPIEDTSLEEFRAQIEINLLGTIYVPKGYLFLGGDKPVAQSSAYTIVIANKIQASAGPTLVLNTNYSATTVPVPEGVGPLSNQIALQR